MSNINYKEIFETYLKTKENDRQIVAELKRRLLAGTASMEDLIWLRSSWDSHDVSDKVRSEGNRLLSEVSLTNIPSWFVLMARNERWIHFLDEQKFEEKVAELVSAFSPKN